MQVLHGHLVSAISAVTSSPELAPPAPAPAASPEGARHARLRGSWFDPLFPQAERSAYPNWLIGILYPLAFVGLAAVALLRQSGVAATNSVWAEDGAIFFRESRLNGFLHTLTIPYNGYLELGPRLFIGLTRLAPTADVAAVVAVTGAGAVALVCCYVFHASRAVLAPVWSRVLVVAVIILLPLATGEILNNDVNVGWWFFFAAFWALITRPRTNADAVLAGVACLLASGTEPLVALLLPLALVRVLVVRSDLRQEAPVIGLVLGLAYQGFGILKASGNSSTFTMANGHGVLQALGLRVGWGWLSGNDLSNHLIKSSQATLWDATGYLLLVAVVVAAVLLRKRATMFFVATAVGFAVITFVVPVVVRGVGPNLVGGPLYVGSRYSATPVLLLWSAVLAEAVALNETPRRVARWAPVLACLVLLVPVWVLDFRQANLRTGGPAWNQEVATAEARCASHRTGNAVLQVSPPGWKVVLPCRDT
jgi:hypothetical protein